ncbi:MAG TPA: 1-deoxy-D-xylulose-5-phosphate reductoisomerase [Gammaproteobacteria bacterium]|nr:1-deoxy-D-xylulose-5-phosphate reductoisomerase [Gammaproteobacteria bacterium]
MTGIAILGSTGTIGINTLDVLALKREKYDLVALTANRSVDELFAQCEMWEPKFAVMADHDCAEKLLARVRARGLSTEVLSGVNGLEYVVALPETNAVMAGIVGAAGLLPSIAAARAGKRVMLANKEALVMSGQLFMDAVAEGNAVLLPIDSEHNAIFQCMPRRFEEGFARVGVRQILLTASGGPFRHRPLSELSKVTPNEACAHPNWVMGRKISVDSATMMNKGLEIIEACWLFHTSQDLITVVIHPQSIIHSMVEYVDGSVLAQLGNPDMRTPIAYALGWPERCESGVDTLDIVSIARLDFEAPDTDRFPCLSLARNAMRVGGTAGAILNAANEAAVAAFLAGRIPFTDIAALIEKALEEIPARDADTLELVLEDDAKSRTYVDELVAQRFT